MSSELELDHKLQQLLDVVSQQTSSGRLKWREGFNDSYQASLGDLSLVIYGLSISGASVYGSIMPPDHFGAVMEFRDLDGEVLQKVSSPDPMNPTFGSTNAYSDVLVRKVEELFRLIIGGKRAKLNAALDGVLGRLKQP